MRRSYSANGGQSSVSRFFCVHQRLEKEENPTCFTARLILISIKYFTYPIAFGDTGDRFRGKVVDCLREAVNNLFQCRKHFIPESLRSQLTPDLFYGIHFRSIGGNTQQRDVFRDSHCFRLMPDRSIADQQDFIIRELL